MEANKQKKADQEPVELVNADGVHVTAQSNGTNSAAAYFAKKLFQLYEPENNRARRLRN